MESLESLRLIYIFFWTSTINKYNFTVPIYSKIIAEAGTRFNKKATGIDKSTLKKQ